MRPEASDFLKDNLDGYLVILREEFLEFEVFPDSLSALSLLPAMDVIRMMREVFLDGTDLTREGERVFPEP